MGTITTNDYADMANKVYNIDNVSNPEGFVVPGYTPDLFNEGMAWGGTKTNFKGCVYASNTTKEVVVAFQGTKLSKAGDLVADVQIFLGMLTQYSDAAYRLFKRCKEVYGGYEMSLVGHSLGGALAQVIGHWTGVPFVTFNAPGMWAHLQLAKTGALASSAQQMNSISGTFKGSALAKQTASTGRNFRNVLDMFISGYGSHYGPVTRFWGAGGHGMDDMQKRIRDSRWGKINPLDARYKEWGEL